MKTITPDELSRTLGRPDAPLLVDVLGPAAAGAPRYAINVPYGDDFVDRFADTCEAVDQPIVVYGSPEDKATVLDAALSLEEAGYRRVTCYLGPREDLARADTDVATHSEKARVGEQPKPIIAGVAEPGARAEAVDEDVTN